MAVALADFRARFPELSEASDTLVNLNLTAAGKRLNSAVWSDDLIDEGQMYLTAHLLAISPFGINARLTKGNGTSVYGAEYGRLKRIVASGHRVTGSTIDLSGYNA